VDIFPLNELIHEPSHPQIEKVLSLPALSSPKTSIRSLANASCSKLNTVQTAQPSRAAHPVVPDSFQMSLICINECREQNRYFLGADDSSKKSNKGKYHVDILQESCAYLRGRCGWCGALRNADFSRTFGNIRHCVVY
jgi:hypothetical protein